MENECYNKSFALCSRGAAIALIFLATALRVLIHLCFLRHDGNPFFIAKVFAAGVILAIAFIHMLPTAHDTLANPCPSEDPWRKLAWAEFITMLGALGMLIVDFAATEFTWVVTNTNNLDRPSRE